MKLRVRPLEIQAGGNPIVVLDDRVAKVLGTHSLDRVRLTNQGNIIIAIVNIAYNFPENMIGEKPRKMRCSRCKNLFTIARRAEAAPSGYKEFTGQHHLPGEFAFLKESPAKEAPPQPEEPPPQLVQPAPPAPIPAQLAPRAPAPPTDTAKPASPQSPSVPEIYSGAASAWETEVPLDLGGFAISNEIPAKGQAIGKLIFVVVVLLVGFLVFIPPISQGSGFFISPIVNIFF